MQFAALQKRRFALHRFVRLRQRYIMTRSNRLRLRYVTGFVCACLMSLGFGLNSLALPLKPDHHPHTIYSAERSGGSPEAGDANLWNPETEITQEMPVQTMPAQDENKLAQIQVSDGIRRVAAALQKPQQPRFHEVEVQRGQTVSGLLQNAGLSSQEAYNAIKALKKHFDVRKIKSGQKIGLHFQPGKNGALEFSKMEMKLNPVKLVSVVRKGAQDFRSTVEEKELVPRSYARKAKIQTSLYGSAAQANIPPQIIAEVIRIYSWDIDFQRDIRRGDKIEVMYEVFETEDGEFARYGDVVYANLSVGGKDIPIYRYEMNNGQVDYFQPDGMSIRKTLMKTPIDGARISSGFGMRKHPVLGYNKMHKGMDFAASTGTPIYAAGDGIVDFAGRNGGYGNYVRIRHNSKLKTAYAHMHKIRSGISKGARVEQGQIIGYVGTTGRSTGPHLHYEVLMNNKQVNPRSVDLPTGEQLTGKEFRRFESLKSAIYQQYVSLSDGMKLAQAPDRKNEEDPGTLVR